MLCILTATLIEHQQHYKSPILRTFLYRATGTFDFYSNWTNRSSFLSYVPISLFYNPEKEARLKRMKSKSEIIDYKIGELQHNLVWAELDANLFETGELFVGCQNIIERKKNQITESVVIYERARKFTITKS